MKIKIGRTVACPKCEMEIGRMALISHHILDNEHYLFYSMAVVASSTRNGSIITQQKRLRCIWSAFGFGCILCHHLPLLAAFCAKKTLY